METYYTIYKITNKSNGKIYIGAHKTDNLDDGYNGSGKIIKLAIGKYGIENFEKEYLAIFDEPDQMWEMESALVNEDFVADDSTYNLKIGGDGGFDHINTDESFRVAKNKNAMTKARECGLDEKRIERIKWLWENDEAWVAKNKYRQSVAMKKRVSDGLWDNPMEGKAHTAETKRKIGEANSKHQQGSGNSQYGSCWITHVVYGNKKIKKEDLGLWISEGWSKGRKMK